MEDFFYKLMNWGLDKKFYNETWYYYLTGEWRDSFPTKLRFWRAYSDVGHKVFSRLPSDPHCYECGIPMAGIGGNALRFMGSSPSSFSPRLCSGCERSARKYEIGAEVELTMIFADVRPSLLQAAAGEILISEDSVKSGNLDATNLESRSLELKGVSQPVSVRVMKV